MERSASGMTDAKFGLTLIAVSVPVLLVHELAVSWRRVETALYGLMLVPGETVAKEVNGKSTQTSAAGISPSSRNTSVTMSNAGLIVSAWKSTKLYAPCMLAASFTQTYTRTQASRI